MTRLLCLDVGERRIGLAVGDTETGVAAPLRTYTRSGSLAAGAEAIRKVAQEQGVDALLLGLPLTEAGEAGAQAKAVREFANHLARSVALPLHWQDERYSTQEARQRLGHGRVSPKQRKRVREEHLDALAAAIILQSYLDEQKARP